MGCGVALHPITLFCVRVCVCVPEKKVIQILTEIRLSTKVFSYLKTPDALLGYFLSVFSVNILWLLCKVFVLFKCFILLSSVVIVLRLVNVFFVPPSSTVIGQLGKK